VAVSVASKTSFVWFVAQKLPRTLLLQSARPAPIPALTSLRFFAALHVLLFHFAQPHVAGAPEFIRSFVAHGDLGVTFFFVLSGFILGYNYLGRSCSAMEFWRRRVARIYPVYFLSILVALPFFFMEVRGQEGTETAIRTVAEHAPAKVFMLHAWFDSMALRWNGPSWSLSVEAFFYVLFPAIAWLLSRVGNGRYVGFAGVALALSLVQVFHLFDLPLPIVSLPLFLLGISLTQVHFHFKPPAWLSPVATVLLVASVGNMGWIEANLPGPSVLIAAAFGLFVYSFGTTNGLAKPLASPSLILLGEASYSLYILHEPLASMFQAVGQRVGGLTMASPVLFWLYLLTTIAVSIWVYKSFELPMQRRLLNRGRTTAGDGPSHKPIEPVPNPSAYKSGS